MDRSISAGAVSGVRPKRRSISGSSERVNALRGAGVVILRAREDVGALALVTTEPVVSGRFTVWFGEEMRFQADGLGTTQEDLDAPGTIIYPMDLMGRPFLIRVHTAF